MDKNYSKGQIIIIHLQDSESYYEGQFHSLNTERTRITLTNVIKHPEDQQVNSILNFFRNEIADMHAMEPEDGMEAVMDTMQGRSLAHHKGPSHAHLSRMSGQTTKPAPEPENTASENWRSNPKYKEYMIKLDTYTIIDKLDSKFQNAVDDLNNCSMIGLALEGVVLGRHGTLCWINMSTNNHTYLFDMLALGNQAYDKGLRDILQSETVKKVIHDCRMAADYLLHKHNIKLVNIIDTQVLELIVKRVQQEKCPSFVSSLHHCIRDFVHVPPPILMFPLVREDFLKRDLKKWAKRPLAPKVLELAVINVVFLVELRLILMNSLLQPAHQGTQFFLNHVSSMSDEDAAMYYSCIHMTPRQMFSIGRKRRDDERGMQRLNPHIRFSRDVMHYFEDASDSDEEGMGIQNTSQGAKPEDKCVNGLSTQLEVSNINQ